MHGIPRAGGCGASGVVCIERCLIGTCIRLGEVHGRSIADLACATGEQDSRSCAGNLASK